MIKCWQIHRWETFPRQLKIYIVSASLIFVPVLLFSQNEVKFSGVSHIKDSVKYDTVHAKRQVSTKSFYDSIYQKFDRHKFSRFLYTLTFVSPKIITLPDSVQHIRSETPYITYKGKTIRNIHIKTLDPFGPTV